jgi:predicted nucleic acid-binding protein
MSEAISDTGPILHLHEINRLGALNVFEQLFTPGLVADELRVYGLDPTNLGVHARVIIVPVSETLRAEVLAESDGPMIQPADAEVFVLAREHGFQKQVLTDDLPLRRRLEAHGAMVIGSIGVLVRAHRVGLLEYADLESAIDALFDESTLHLSRAFRSYIRQLLADLP